MLYSRPFILMAVAQLFISSSFGAFFILPIYITYLGGTKMDIGIVMGAFALASVLCRPFVSEMIDRIGRKKSYTLGCVIMALLPLTYLLFQNDLAHIYPALLAVRLAHGVGLALTFTAAFTYIADIIPDRRLNEGIGTFGITGLTGIALGPVVAEIVLRKYGFGAYFVTGAALGTIGLLVQLPVPESYMRSMHTSSRSFFSVLAERKITTVFALAMLFGVAMAAYGGFVSPYAEAREIRFFSVYYIAYSFMAVITRLFGGRFADRVGEERILPYALLMTGTGLLSLVFMSGLRDLVVAGLLSGCGHGFLFPCLNALAIRGRPSHILGKVNGVFMGGIDAGAFAGSIVLGRIGDWAGFQAIFLAAGLSIISGIVLHRLRMVRTA